MAKTRVYRHYCPVARSLEVIGEKWSLLIVRDLLAGALRFSDLLRYLSGITPKWLTWRLRDLEDAGILERESEPGRREVWYRLTPKGRELAPVVEALSVWGIEHALQPPRPGEPVHPGQPTSAVVSLLNQRGPRLAQPATWVVRLADNRSYTICFDGELWSVRRGNAEDQAKADLIVETTPEEWVGFLMATPEERRERAQALRITGDPARVDELISIFAYKQ